MGESKFMGEVEAYYQDASGQYPEIKAQIQNDRDTMLTERAEADKARRAYQLEERKLADAQGRLESIKEDIRKEKERRREAARNRGDSDEDTKDSLDDIDREIERLEDAKEETKDEIRRIKDARDQYIYEEDVHQRAAEKAQNRLKKAVRQCGSLAKSLSMHVEVVKFEADATSNQAGGFGSMSSIRFGRGASQNAKTDRTTVSSKYKTLAGQISSLADKYAQLAQTDTGGPSGGSGQKSGSGKSAADRGRELAVAAATAAVMLTGAMNAATRPIDTTQTGSSGSSYVQMADSRVSDVFDALAEPNDIVDDMKKRRKLLADLDEVANREAPKY